MTPPKHNDDQQEDFPKDTMWHFVVFPDTVSLYCAGACPGTFAGLKFYVRAGGMPQPMWHFHLEDYHKLSI